MFTRRPSDENWIKYLLSSQLVTVDQFQTMRGNQNQVDIGDLLCRHANLFDGDSWLNKALQQDRFHYLPLTGVDERELAELQMVQPLLVGRALVEGVLPLGFSHQTIYLGLLRYDPEFPELQEISHSLSPELRVCLVPVAPEDFGLLNGRIRGMVAR